MTNWKSKEYDFIADSLSANEYLSEENARRALAMGKDILGEVVTLANAAQDWKADPDRTDWAISDYLSNPSPYSFHLAARKIFSDAYDLSAEFVHLNYGIDDLFNLAAEGQLRGSEETLGKYFKDPKQLDALKAGRAKGGGGLPAARKKIITPQTEKLYGIPPGLGLSTKDMDKGMELAQQRGLEDATGSPEYWKDFKSMPTEQLVAKHKKKLDQMEAEKSAELDKRFKEYVKAKQSADIDRELDRRRWQREKERKEKLEKRRMRRRKSKKKKTKKLYRVSPIITPWGVFTIVIFYDGDTAIVEMKNGKINVILPKGNWAYNAYLDADGNLHGTPMIGRRIGQRRASPLQPPNRPRGPIGR